MNLSVLDWCGIRHAGQDCVQGTGLVYLWWHKKRTTLVKNKGNFFVFLKISSNCNKHYHHWYASIGTLKNSQKNNEKCVNILFGVDMCPSAFS